MADKLTPKQARFVEEYLVDLNATQAAIRAGYSEKTARQVASENLSKPYIQEAVAQAPRERSERTKVDQDWVIERLIAIHDAAMGAHPVYDKEGEEKGFTFNPNAANRALELLGRHLGMFTDRLDLGGTLGIRHEDALEVLTEDQRSRLPRRS